jgi:hypothetical protein
MLRLNYIGVFLTFRCNLGCDYCLNKQGDFAPRKEISVDDWVKILYRLPTREDLPITLQGGEPTLYPEFYSLVGRLALHGHKIDILTNGCFDPKDFLDNTTPSMFQRKAPYASIRFSFHKNTDDLALLHTVLTLKNRGYSVGIWGLTHPAMWRRNLKMMKHCRRYEIDYREKEYLDKKYGTYKYPAAVDGKEHPEVRCRSSELLYAPDGKLHRCHRFLYSGIESDGIECRDFGFCNPCDVKLKTNRLQQGGHCSVRIEK